MAKPFFIDKTRGLARGRKGPANHRSRVEASCVERIYGLCVAVNSQFIQSQPPRGNGTVEADMEYRQTPYDCARWLDYKDVPGPWEEAMKLTATIHEAGSRLAELLSPHMHVQNGNELYGRVMFRDQ